MAGTSVQVRIGAGRWRGRILRYPAIAGLRPTPGRSRETLFNWLQGHLHGMRVLELYAGSAVVSLEALSRGAAMATAVEQNRRLATRIDEHRRQLDAPLTVLAMPVERALAQLAGETFDLIIVDPPYEQFAAPDALITLLKDLATTRLKPEGWLALDHPQRFDAPELPGMTLHRQTRAGAARLSLYRCADGQWN